jgi:hypothetical protein
MSGKLTLYVCGKNLSAVTSIVDSVLWATTMNAPVILIYRYYPVIQLSLSCNCAFSWTVVSSRYWASLYDVWLDLLRAWRDQVPFAS